MPSTIPHASSKPTAGPTAFCDAPLFAVGLAVLESLALPVGVDDMPVLAVIAPVVVSDIVIAAEPDAVVGAGDCEPPPTPLAVPVMVTGNSVMSVELSCIVVEPISLASLPPTLCVHIAWVTGEPVKTQLTAAVLIDII